jgi:hypothetical protein
MDLKNLEELQKARGSYLHQRMELLSRSALNGLIELGQDRLSPRERFATAATRVAKHACFAVERDSNMFFSRTVIVGNFSGPLPQVSLRLFLTDTRSPREIAKNPGPVEPKEANRLVVEWIHAREGNNAEPVGAGEPDLAYTFGEVFHREEVGLLDLNSDTPSLMHSAGRSLTLIEQSIDIYEQLLAAQQAAS